MVEFDRQYNKILVKRKRRSIKRRLFIVFKIFLLIIFFAVLVWGFNYFYNSSYFKINSIIVEGNQKYNEEEIKKAAEIILGANIFEIDKKYAEDRLIKELVWLKDVNLKKVFPDKIEIKVSERNPFVKAAYGGSWYIIDEEGVVLDKIFAGNQDNYGNLILVKNALKYNPVDGEKLAKKNIISCGFIYRILDLEVKKIIREAYIKDNFMEDIVFLTNNNKHIIFGTSDRISEKNAILRQVLDKVAEENIEYSVIDLSDIVNPTIK